MVRLGNQAKTHACIENATDVRRTKETGLPTRLDSTRLDSTRETFGAAQPKGHQTLSRITMALRSLPLYLTHRP